MTFPLSAGVYENIIDKSFLPEGQGPISGGIVVRSKRGPVETTYITSSEQLQSLYGLPTKDNPSLHSAFRFMRVGGALTVRRVINDATAAEGVLMSGTDEHLNIYAANPGTWGNDITVRFGQAIGTNPAATPDGFTVIVLDGADEVERHEVSRDPDAKDGFGRNVYIEEVINGKSRYITVDDNVSIAGDYDMTSTVTLSGGTDDTVAPSSTEIVAAWDDFRNDEFISADILINGGFAVADVQMKMIEIAEVRSNCRAILDVPFEDAADVDAMISWRQGFTTSTTRGALYGGWIEVNDPYNNRHVFIPPSGDVAAIIVKTFNEYEPWDAPAGMRRGVINAIGTSKIFSETERDDLYVNGINPVTTYGGQSAVVWGQKMLQYQEDATAMGRLNVVNNVLWITDRCQNILKRFVFEPNTEFQRNEAGYLLTSFLEGIQDRAGVYMFKVDTQSQNTPEVIQRNQFIANVLIQPTITSEFIRLNVTVAPTGVNIEFAE